MLRHLTHRLPLIVLLGLLANGLPPASLVTPPSASAQSTLSRIEEPSSQPLAIPPVVEPHLPSLALHLALAPNPVAIGDTIALTLTITNEAADPAEDLVVALPTPDGALALPSPYTLSPTTGWRWPIGHLDGLGSMDVIGQLRLLHRPPAMRCCCTPRPRRAGSTCPSTRSAAPSSPTAHSTGHHALHARRHRAAAQPRPPHPN
jgi:hypothetical protein